SYTLNDGTTVPSLLGMAYWNPTIDGIQYRKGGVGSYHMEYEYSLAGIVNTYPYLRKAISIMNPVIK
ncbi:MAG: glycoside hydrolase family 18, partial [Prevotella sp.]